ncbi:aspartic proteinase 36-like isoform X1 [Juglans microcarpa x Juglans regia]|uniref:aspartic proteinase 36-like isoform X1 n=1 Tax=Juglans microcarpa x Juglans regia TaxID=2249226 RepID=UPI001B7EB220|nr:aspartic proteinase 36-like isoform X1 [Juglans microcarpa x Juglans regia]
MARTLAHLLASALLIFSSSLIALSSALDDSDPSLRPPMMILPLYLSSPNPNISRHRNLRRHLQNSAPPNARMRLYDDLLSHGYYTTRLWIGTPPQEFALIVDTGSTVTYVPCSNCGHCGKHQDPRFQPELSSTYQPMKCSISCNCDEAGAQCTYERRYAEMSSSSGVLGEDTISFGNESKLIPQRAVFGCEDMETGDLYTQHADGIIGLGRGRLSVMDQLVDKGAISDSFSLCYGGMDVGGGAMVLGGISSPPDMVYTNSDPFRSPYYNIELKEIHVAGKPLKLKPSIFDGRHGTVLDSGTTYAYLPKEAFLAFKNAVINKIRSLKQIHGPDPNFHDICFSGAGRNVSQLSAVFPQVDMVFSNGHKLSLSPENYLFRHTKASGAYCLGIFQNADDPTTLLGGIIVRNTLVTYDRENDKIGFWKTNCSELWKGLHYPSPAAPPPLDLRSQNTSVGIPPTIAPGGLPPIMAPVGLPHADFPVGEFQIGLITFDMMLIINNSSMKPNFTELTEFIAHALDVKVSQVHFLNFSYTANASLIKWAIFPDESADYISNAMATSIIHRLRDHRLQLPEKFGSYQLVELNVKPPVKLTWWKQNYWVLAVGVLATLVLGLSISGAWLIWRSRQENVSYEPVDAVVPEQELQPLQTSPGPDDL